MQQTSAFDELLKQCRDLVCGQLDQAVAGMLEKTDETLSALAIKTQNRETQKLYLQAKDAARAQRAEIEKSFHARYLSEFQQRANKAKKSGDSFSDVEVSSLELSLVGDDDLNETLKFNEMAAKLRRFCDEEIAALDQRVGVLLGDAGLESEDNPFSPQAICDAYKHACRHADANVSVRMVFLKLFDDHVLDAIRPVYKAVNELLVQNSILPKIRYGVTRKEGGKTPSKGGKDAAEDQAEDAAEGESAAGGQDVFAALQKLFAGKAAGGRGGVAGAAPGQPVLQGAELLGSLTKLQLDGLAAFAASGAQLAAGGAVAGTTNVLHELKSSEVGASMGQMDAMTLDIVAMLFDQLFEDPKVPAGIKGLIGRMQIPMLKVAIADKAFFSKKSHPARQLLDTLGDIAMRLPADFDATNPLYARLEAILQELIDGFQDNIEIFDALRVRLEALLAEEDQRAAQETEAAAKLSEQREHLALARTMAQEQIKARVGDGKAPRPVIEFLAQQWIKYLLIAHVQGGKESDAWKSALETMDQLVWSVDPKKTVEERRKLATMVPGLIKRVTGGLTAAGIEDSVRTRFFAELMDCHTKVLHAGGKDKPAAATTPEAKKADAAAAKPAATAAAPGKDAKPGAAAPAPAKDAKPVAAAAPSDEMVLDFTAPVTVKNPFGAGEVQVDELDFTDPSAPAAPAAPGAPRAKATPKEIELPFNLVLGVWVEIHDEAEDAPRVRAKLSHISPLKSRYLFVNRQGKTLLECSRAELSRRLRLREIAILKESSDESLFDRIMGGLVGKLGGAAG